MRLEIPGEFADQAFNRACGTPRVPGNRVRLLKDATENYPAWTEAIKSAEKWIHFETYVIHEDDAGRYFADILSAKAREGIKVRLIHDWVGSVRNASRQFWRRLAADGVDIRCFNRPSLSSPFGWTSRDHRKLLSVDGRIAYISGLCIGQGWVGNPERAMEPWRDTGVEIAGPALESIERAFADTWAISGTALPHNEKPMAIPAVAGDVPLRIVASVPGIGSTYRIDQLVTMLASKSIWLADAYFVGTSSYVQALRSAARSGVDVRLLVPGTNDVPVMRAVSRAGLRPLLEAGVRIFEWNGSMMHAKTAVADGMWARVGSTNLNVSSWFANWELDVIIEDERLAKQMGAMFLDDLAHSTEIVLDRRRRRPIPASTAQLRRIRGRSAGARRTAAGVMRISHALGAAITRRRELGPAEAVIMLWGAALLAAFSFVAVYWPRVVAFPAAILCAWIAVSLVTRALKLRWRRRHRRDGLATRGHL